MKADFNLHEGTFLLYPTRTDVWRRNAVPIKNVIKSLANTISRFEKVILGTLPNCDVENVSAQITPIEYNDIWVRDSGAVPLENSLIKFGFNAWGGEDGLYSDWSLDKTVPEQMSKILNKPLKEFPLTIEGGNLATNGNGVIICIKNTVVNDNRNPKVSEEDAKSILKNALKARKVIFIENGLKYDETGGHIDNLLAFADEKTVLLAWTDDENNPQYDIVRQALKTLENESNFNVIKIPLPSTFLRTKDDCDGLVYEKGSKERYLGEIIQPSYINFIFVNGGVIIPSFGDEKDDEVAKIFKSIFTDREIIQFPSREIVLGGGGLHCITKNF